jgi:uncharacterized protein
VSRVFTVILIIFALDAIWWSISNHLARTTRWRYFNTAFILLQAIALVWLVWGRLSGSGLDHLLPKFAVTALVIWHTIVLPILLILCIVTLPIVGIYWLIRWISKRQEQRLAENTSDSEKWSRRQFLGFAAGAVPPILTVSLTSIALQQLGTFRVRRIVLPIANLPPDLHGVTIAQVSDMHVGRFTSGRILRHVVETTNALQADLVLLTGDLINDALAYLDEGLELTRAMEARFGVYLIEGNHDLIENGPEFERRVKQSGIPFLLDESTVVNVRGTPVQLFGLSWTRGYENRDQRIATSVQRLLAQRQPDAFPILLAHHPHAFDAAVFSSIPLILSGHTHGGQLMLTDQFGFGPALFRYWSGLYTRGASNLIVSNGVGNWFPLRVNAPAEIIHLTLTRK